MAEWLGRGLQNLAQQFDSASDLSLYGIQYITMPGWWNGRHRGLKIPRPHGRASSSLALGTKKAPFRELLFFLYLLNKFWNF